MTLTPLACASLVTAAPVVESIEASTRTCTWSVLIIVSAMVFSALVSPLAFWMVQSRFCLLHSAWIAGASALAHRAEVAVSGRMTPTLGFAPALPEEPEEGELELEQAATPNAKAAAPTVAVRTALRIIALWSFLSAGPVAVRPDGAAIRNVVTGNVLRAAGVVKGSCG